jgi:thiamine-monophosphate kinase
MELFQLTTGRKRTDLNEQDSCGDAMDRAKKTIAQVGEFGFIRSVMMNCVHAPEKVIQGIGDDCAVIGPYEDRVLLITTDLLVEDVHFLRGKISFRELGAKAVAVNLSDIAAMGGIPRHLFVSLAIPRRMPVEDLSELDAGMKDMCRTYGVNLLGGDTSASQGGLFINVTVIGEADAKAVLYRKGASSGDRVYVTGTVGNAGAGLRLLQEELIAHDDLREALIAAHNRPRPRLEQGRLIAGSMLASSMIDISDGLLSDLGHICEESGVGARIFEERLPLSDELKALCRVNSLDPSEMALSGGEDYELLFTVPVKNAESLEALLQRHGHLFFEIGRITEGKSIRVVLAGGTEKEVTPSGFDHFAPAKRSPCPPSPCIRFSPDD